MLNEKNFNYALALAVGTAAFEPYVADLQKFVNLMNTNKEAARVQYEKVQIRLNYEVWVNNPLDMLIALAWLNYPIEERIFHHKETLAVDAQTKASIQLFDTSITVGGENVNNMQRANGMGKDEVCFVQGIGLDYLSDMSVAEFQRVDKGGMFKTFANNGKQIYTKPCFEIPSVEKRDRHPIGTNAGSSTTADTMHWKRGDGNPFRLKRFIQFGAEEKIEMRLDIDDVTDQALAGDVEFTLFTLYAVNR